MTQSRLPARHARRLEQDRRRPRHLKSADDLWLNVIARTFKMLDETERELRAKPSDSPPGVLADFLKRAADARRELEALRQDILLNPRF